MAFTPRRLMRGASAAREKDPYFNYVTMLLHGDGTNGAQNNTFVDSGPNTFSITRGGNTTQGSFSPYGSNWSNFLNGSSGAAGGPYLSFPNSSTMQLGAGNFTIEAWCYFNVVQESTIIARYPFDATNNEWNLQTGSSLIPNFSYTTGGNTAAGSVGPNTALSTNTWYHIAVVRNSSTLTMYINGTSVATSSISATIYAGTTASTVGTYAQSPYPGGYAVPNGYLSNVRVVKGTAVYTSNFTPSTTPLTAISGTSLLTCQSNRFVDNSTNNFAVTLNSTPSVQRFNPFGASTAYDTSVIGGSAYFDGNDYLSGPTNETAFQFGTGDFTVEAWVYHTADDTYPSILEIGDHLATTGILFIKFGPGGGNVAAIYSGGFKGSTPVTMNAWNHIAYVRSSGSLKIYVNGVSPAGVAFTNNLTNSNKVTIGTDQNLTVGYYFAGNISNLRVVKGTAVYTANFTPPTAPLTAISGTSLLMPMTNAAIFDNAMMNNLETVGNAQISTSVKKYGTGSIALDGTGDYLVSNSPTTNLYAFGTGDFTIEGWYYFDSVTTEQEIFDFRPESTQGAYPMAYVWTDSKLYYWVSSANRITSSTTLSTGIWYHIAVCRSGTSTKMFINGTQSGSTYTDSTNYLVGDKRPAFGINAFQLNVGFINGYIDDLRITKGFARYTANFTAPTAAFKDTGPV